MEMEMERERKKERKKDSHRHLIHLSKRLEAPLAAPRTPRGGSIRYTRSRSDRRHRTQGVEPSRRPTEARVRSGSLARPSMCLDKLCTRAPCWI